MNTVFDAVILTTLAYLYLDANAFISDASALLVKQGVFDTAKGAGYVIGALLAVSEKKKYVIFIAFVS
jgi:hypothetical protein